MAEHTGTWRGNWTPVLARNLADVLLAAGAGDCRSVFNLRQAAAANSPALAHRAEMAYNDAVASVGTEPDWPQYRDAATALMRAAEAAEFVA